MSKVIARIFAFNFPPTLKATSPEMMHKDSLSKRREEATKEHLIEEEDTEIGIYHL